MGWGAPRKLDYAARIAAAVGYIGLVNLDRVGAVAFANRVERLLPPRRGRGHIFRLFEFLHGLPTPAGGRSSLREAMWEYVHKTKRRGLLLIISDLLYPDGYEEGLELARRSEEHTSELQSRENLVCRLLLEKKKNNIYLIRNKP